MQKNIKTTLLLVSFLSSMTWLVGCKKNNSTSLSIAGVWTTVSGSNKDMVSGQLTYDTSYQIAPTSANYGILTLNANGSFNFQHGFAELGLYTYVNNTLTLTDTNKTGKTIYTVASQANNTLSLELVDTVSTNPLTLTIYNTNFSK